MSTTTSSVDAIVQEITIKAPAARVFEALVDPAQRLTWWGQKGRFETTNAESDLRPGGRWLMSGMGMGRKKHCCASSSILGNSTRQASAAAPLSVLQACPGSTIGPDTRIGVYLMAPGRSIRSTLSLLPAR